MEPEIEHNDICIGTFPAIPAEFYEENLPSALIKAKKTNFSFVTFPLDLCNISLAEEYSTVVTKEEVRAKQDDQLSAILSDNLINLANETDLAEKTSAITDCWHYVKNEVLAAGFTSPSFALRGKLPYEFHVHNNTNSYSLVIPLREATSYIDLSPKGSSICDGVEHNNLYEDKYNHVIIINDDYEYCPCHSTSSNINRIAITINFSK
jgi:hypothetical protein